MTTHPSPLVKVLGGITPTEHWQALLELEEQQKTGVLPTNCLFFALASKIALGVGMPHNVARDLLENHLLRTAAFSWARLMRDTE